MFTGSVSVLLTSTSLKNMTLDVENCHATVHSKKVDMSKLEYARSFGATMKESVKRATSNTAAKRNAHEHKI